LSEVLSGGQGGITLSLDPTAVPIIRMANASDTLTLPSSGDYIIGNGDVINVSIFSRNISAETDAEEVTVRQDGKIFLRLLGEIQAEGLTVNQLQEQVLEGTVPFIKQPFVQVEIAEYNSQHVIVFGEIAGTGGAAGGRGRIVPLKGPTPLMQIFASLVQQTSGAADQDFSAPPSVVGDLSNVVVTRRDGERFRVNLNTYLFGMNKSANIEIRDGDLIFIPHIQNNRAFVLGEVNSQGPIPIGLGLTTTESIAHAGGFTELARRNDVKVIRGGFENPEVINVSARDVFRKGHRDQDVALRNGDIVFVPRSSLGNLNVLLAQILPPLQSYLLIQALF
jgi:polysaccharide export outer membrane protein